MTQAWKARQPDTSKEEEEARRLQVFLSYSLYHLM
jgi:hypothetical protein